MKKFNEIGISYDITNLMDIDVSINPVGQKNKAQYTKYIFSNLSDSQAHGVGDYDIRYYTFNNPNWTIDEKKKLVYEFWKDDEEYDELLDQWEWEIINEVLIDFDYKSEIEKDYLYCYQYNDLLNMLNNESVARKVWKDIQFCKLMHQFRPQQVEIKKEVPKILRKY